MYNIIRFYFLQLFVKNTTFLQLFYNFSTTFLQLFIKKCFIFYKRKIFNTKKIFFLIFLMFNILVIYYTFFHKIIIFLKEFSTKKN